MLFIHPRDIRPRTHTHTHLRNAVSVCPDSRSNLSGILLILLMFWIHIRCRIPSPRIESRSSASCLQMKSCWTPPRHLRLPISTVREPAYRRTPRAAGGAEPQLRRNACVHRDPVGWLSFIGIPSCKHHHTAEKSTRTTVRVSCVRETRSCLCPTV